MKALRAVSFAFILREETFGDGSFCFCDEFLI